MSMRTIAHDIFAWVKCNLKLLCIKAIGLMVRITPWKVPVIEAMGILRGLISMCLKFKQWKAITRFARQTGSAIPGWLYILKYFIQKGSDQIWEIAFFEAPSALEKYFTIENNEMLEQAVKEGRGIVLLGAHYGPRLYRLFFWKMNLDFKALVSYGTFRRQKDTSTLGIRPLVSRKASFYRDNPLSLVAKQAEREFVHHLRKGGVIAMYIDVPRQQQGGVVTEFFGFPMRFNYFPFKLALRYNAPVFFCFFDKAKNGGYRLRFVPCGDFSTPDEGVKKYASFFQAQIATYPFMWKVLPNFVRWLSTPSEG